MGIEFNILRAMFILVPAFWTLQDVVLFSLGSGTIRPTEVAGLLIVACFARQLFIWRPDSQLNLIRYLIWTGLVFGVPAVFMCRDFKSGIGDYLRRFTPYLILLATAHSVRNPVAYRKMLFAMLMGGVVLLSLAIRWKLSGQVYEAGGYNRLVVGGMRFQQLGMYLGVFVGLAAAGLRLWPRWWLKLLTVFALAGLYLTLFRTGWAVAIILVVPLALSLREGKFLRMLLVAVLLLLCLNWVIVKRQFLRLDRERAVSADSVLSGRLSFNSAVVGQFAELSDLQWLLGTGFRGTFDLGERGFGERSGVHNDYLEILMEMGFFSLLIYCAILFVMLRAAIRRMRVRAGPPQDYAAWLGLLMVIVMIVPGMVLAWYSDVTGGILVQGVVGMMFGVYPERPSSAGAREPVSLRAGATPDVQTL